MQNQQILLKNILVIYPHWPPSNLAGVHRPRLISNFLREFDWNPIILTVDSKYYEEKLDFDMLKTVNEAQTVYYTRAFKISKPRLVGDIGLRAFPFLFFKALEIIKEQEIKFVWIPIPSFYTSILGRFLYSKTKIPYGIDYIDPWIRDIKSRADWRHRLSNLLARWLEPFAVKKAALISGVSKEYYDPMIKRNFSTTGICNVAMPYGFDARDHDLPTFKEHLPWSIHDKVWLYAGAFLPNSRIFIETLFKIISRLRDLGTWSLDYKLFFIGTGDYKGKTIAAYASEYGLPGIVTEIRDRFPYLAVLNLLKKAHTVMIIGSTESHYTASKVYQSLLSNRPIWGVLHGNSSAVRVLQECEADDFLVRYDADLEESELERLFLKSITDRLNHHRWKLDLQKLDKYSARSSAKALVDKLEQIL